MFKQAICLTHCSPDFIDRLEMLGYKNFYDVLNDIVNKFNTLARKQRREILSVLRRVKKENVIRTEN